MGLSFTNPLALWALLGLPAIVVVHLLQSRNRTAHTSTLFLLEHLAEETRQGAVITKLRTGAQLWLQLLAVLLFTLLVAQPRRVSEQSIQSLVLVIDSSLSMQAFPEERESAVQDILTSLEGSAARLEWWVLPSDEALPRVGAGEGRLDLEAVLTQMTFPSGGHDASARLREARLLAGSEGLVVFLTDHAIDEVRSGATVVSVGEPVPNVGIFGIQPSDIRNGALTWRVGVINPSASPARRVLIAEQDGQERSRMEIELGPGAMQSIEVPWIGSARGVFRLEPADRFPADDVWPFVVPQPKTLTVSIPARDAVANWAGRIVGTVQGASKGAGGEVEIRTVKDQWRAAFVAGDVQFISTEETHSLQRVLAEPHPLVEGLNWEGLLVEPVAGFTTLPTDIVLLWMGEHPLMMLRPRPGGVSLVCLFDPTKGNALRNSSLALVMHRFLIGVQNGLEAPAAVNALTGQAFQLPEGSLQMESLRGDAVEVERSAGRWPKVPGWATVIQEEELKLEVGIANGEVEEGDFREARPQPLPEEVVLQQRKQHEERDVLFPLWAGLLGAVILGSWRAGQQKGWRT